MSIEEYLLVEARIKKEEEKVKELEAELQKYALFPTIDVEAVGGFPLSDTAAVRIVGSILHDYYTAIENAFKVVATRIDKSVPQGEQWHKELLEQMSLEISGVRVPLISPATAAKLQPMRGFRHVFRNVYGFELSSSRVKELLQLLPTVSTLVKGDFQKFMHEMRKIYKLE